jgi:hypothetical protein
MLTKRGIDLKTMVSNTKNGAPAMIGRGTDMTSHLKSTDC